MTTTDKTREELRKALEGLIKESKNDRIRTDKKINKAEKLLNSEIDAVEEKLDFTESLVEKNETAAAKQIDKVAKQFLGKVAKLDAETDTL